MLSLMFCLLCVFRIRCFLCATEFELYQRNAVHQKQTVQPIAKIRNFAFSIYAKSYSYRLEFLKIIIGWANRTVVHPTKILGGPRPPAHHTAPPCLCRTWARSSSNSNRPTPSSRRRSSQPLHVTQTPFRINCDLRWTCNTAESYWSLTPTSTTINNITTSVYYFVAEMFCWTLTLTLIVSFILHTCGWIAE